MLRKLPLIALLSVLLPLQADARGRPKTETIYNPTITLSSKAKLAEVKKGVKLAVLNRKWQIANEKGNEFDATYDGAGGWHHREDFRATIHVSYDTKQVKIAYVKSEGLSQEGDQIHKNYNMWIKNLESDIPIYVEREVTASQ